MARGPLKLGPPADLHFLGPVHICPWMPTAFAIQAYTVARERFLKWGCGSAVFSRPGGGGVQIEILELSRLTPPLQYDFRDWGIQLAEI